MKKRWSLSAIPQSSGTNRGSMTAGVTSPDASASQGSQAKAPRADARLNGKVLKKNGGFLRQWRMRPMVVTADGFLRYEKKKGDITRTKETDLLKSEISSTLSLQGNYYCIEIQSGQKQFSLGFSSKSEARLWQEVMHEVADANAGGRRLWVAQLRRVLTLNLRDRRDAVEAMGNRDWLTEWNFCWKSLKNRHDEDFNGRRRRLKRLYTIWLQFHVFAEIVAEIHFATVQSRDINRNPSSRDISFNKGESDVSDSRSDSSLLPSTGWAVTWSNTQVEDVDTVKVKAMKLEYGSKTWGGEKQLKKEVADLARFRQKLEELTSARGMHDAMSKFPVFPLMAAFSIRGIQVVASALPLSDDIEVVKVDRRDLAEVSGGLRLHGDLSSFTFGEFPDVWIRRVRGSQEGEIVQVTSKYDDVLRGSLRSSMVHGVLLRAGKDSIEVLSAHDINELVQGISPRWTPFLNLFYYQLESNDAPINNHPARQFLLKRPKSLSCHGDIVIAIEPNRSRLQLNLKEAFIQKYQMELLPVVRRLNELRSTSVHMVNGAVALKSTEVMMSDPAAAIADELEATIKHLLRRHIQDIAKKLVTMGDDVSSWTNDSYDRVNRSTFSSSTPRQSFQGDYRQRQSSIDSLPSAAQRGKPVSGSIYVIDATHLRRTLKRQGVNTNLFPLVFALVSDLRQPGIEILLASDIISRIAKTLFQFRLSHDQNAEKSRWRSRKSRLIEFITQIMAGLHDEEGASQFWDVDAPIWFLLGPYAASIALDYGVVKPATAIQTYRQTLRTNPAVLFNSLLQIFGAHLADGYLPALDETRWISLQFLRREGQLNFFDEAIDPKLAIAYHYGWLSATMQSFRLNFEHLQRLFVDRGGSITAKSEIQSAKIFFAALASQFRHSVASSSETRVENAILSLDIHQAAGRSIVEAHIALQEYRLDSARDLARQACDGIAASGAQLSFPLELKIYLLAIMALSDRETGPLSPTKKGTSALAKRWSSTLSWLQHFYRAASSSSLLPTVCPHPLADSIRLMVGNARSNGRYSEGMQHSLDSISLRVATERGVAAEMWETLSPIVERQFHLSGPSGVARVTKAETSAPDSTLSRANSDLIQKDLFQPAELMRSSSDPLQMVQKSTGGAKALGLATSRMDSSWDRVLRTLEQLLLPVVNEVKGCWLIPGYLFDLTATQNTRFPPIVMKESVPVPGMALMWGRSNGLSLDDESKLSTSKVDGIRCRPNSHFDIRVLEFPLPTRRVLQVSCGYRHTALITAGDQCLYTFGYGECGRLGHGDEQSVELPKRVEFFYDLARQLGGPRIAGAHQVSCGREHTMVVLANGELFGFGWAEAGRLGTGESGSVVNPSKVYGVKDTEAVACGREHTLALTKSGDVYSFGAGFGGRLGNGGENDEELPVLVAGLKGQRVVQVDAGECHSGALTQDGDVFTWGFGSSGALGTGSRDNAYTPIKVEGPWVESREGERAVGIACGSYHTLAYTTHGRLYGWGDSAAGQLGEKLLDAEDMVVLKPQQLKLPRSPAFQSENNSLQRIRAIACGTFTSAMSTLDGKLFVWGSAAAGNGAELDKEDAKLKQVNVLSEFPVDQIACGAYHCVALSSTPVWT